MLGHIKNVAVFCGSRFGNLPVFREEAEALGTGLAESGLGLVYGSGGAGLMGAVSGAARAAGGKVIGINVSMFNEVQAGTPEGVEEITTETMLERKGRLMAQSHAYLHIGGGIGTIDEAGDVMAENDLTYLQDASGIVKPVIFVNTKVPNPNGGAPIGYYDPFLQQLELSLAMGFTNANTARYYTQVDTAQQAIELLKRLNDYGPISNAHTNTQRVLRDLAQDVKAELPAPVLQILSSPGGFLSRFDA